MTKKIVILASGTRGDVEPMIALAKRLYQENSHVVVATHSNFQALFADQKIEFRNLDGNPSELLARPEKISALTYDGNLARNFRISLRYIQEAKPIYESLLRSSWLACRDAELIIASLPTIWANQISEKLGIQCVYAFFQPISRTRYFPASILPVILPANRVINWLSYALVEQAAWLPWRSVINKWRKEYLNLHPAPLRGTWEYLYSQNQLVCYAYSRFVVNKPPDWPEKHHITGYWFHDHHRELNYQQTINSISERGEPVLYIGFGSPGGREPDKAAVLIHMVLEKLNIRGVIDINSEYLLRNNQSKYIIPVRGMPHSILFNYVTALIHHGGAGTTASGIRAGKPALVLPHATDQYFWAGRVKSLGIGPVYIPQRRITYDNLLERIQKLFNKEYFDNARVLADKIASEDGLSTAVKLIQAQI